MNPSELNEMWPCFKMDFVNNLKKTSKNILMYITILFVLTMATWWR